MPHGGYRAFNPNLAIKTVDKWNFKKFKDVTLSKKRTLCAPPAPPHGLFLKKVIY